MTTPETTPDTPPDTTPDAADASPEPTAEPTPDAVGIPISVWVGRRIHAARKAAGLSAVALATKLGIRVGQVWRWEVGENPPPIPRLVSIARALGVEPGSLLPTAAEAALMLSTTDDD